MPWYEKNEKSSVVLKALKKLKLELGHGKKHDTATCPKTQAKTLIPRHKVLNKYTMGSIYEFLIDNGYEETEIKKALRWK